MSHPRSFAILGRDGRKYRIFFHSFTGFWYAAFHDGQKRQRVSVNATNKLEAESAVRKLDAPPVETRSIERVTWTDFQTRYLNYKRDTGRAPKTITRYNGSMEAFGRYLRKTKMTYIDEVSLSVLEGYTPYRVKIEKCDTKSAYCDALTIKNALKWASKASRGFLKLNPAVDWETPEPIKPKRRMYTMNEVAVLETGVRKWLRAVVTTLAWTGMRIGELVALRWKNVDLERRLIHIRIQLDWTPKGRRDRTVPMHPKVETVLRSLPTGEYVFTGARGGRIKETYALTCLKADQKKLKLQSNDLHGFRRFFATTMMQAGVSVDIVRQWGGWQSLETMLRYLADVDATDSIQAMDTAVKQLNTIQK